MLKILLEDLEATVWELRIQRLQCLLPPYGTDQPLEMHLYCSAFTGNL